MDKYKTEQEKFWAEEFGNEYIQRNHGDKLLASNLNFFSKAFSRVGNFNSIIEFGANIGMNLKALKLLYPGIEMKGIEINKSAADELSNVIGKNNVINSSIFDVDLNVKVNITMIKGVLIHINPTMLENVYQKLYDLSNNYIFIAEYYNPSPVNIPYRGHSNKLFKRDFAGEFLNKFKDTELVDYGFVYRYDPAFPQDDITWFLIKKQ